MLLESAPPHPCCMSVFDADVVCYLLPAHGLEITFGIKLLEYEVQKSCCLSIWGERLFLATRCQGSHHSELV
jgi:hypothetical protein